MNLRDLAIGVVLISGMLLAVTAIYSDMFFVYGVNESGTNATAFSSSTLSKMYNKTNSIQASLNQSTPSEISTTDSLGNFANNVINAFFVIMDLPALTIDLVNQGLISIGLPIPSYVTMVIFTIIVLFVLFEILSGVLKWRI